jgi:hypothetical protein
MLYKVFKEKLGLSSKHLEMYEMCSMVYFYKRCLKSQAKYFNDCFLYIYECLYSYMQNVMKNRWNVKQSNEW